jgi:hypothetical protein
MISFIGGLLLTSVVAFTAFCFYCGIKAMGEKLKKDGLHSLIEITVIALIVTAVLLLVMGRVGDMVIPAPAQQMFIV